MERFNYIYDQENQHHPRKRGRDNTGGGGWWENILQSIRVVSCLSAEDEIVSGGVN